MAGIFKAYDIRGIVGDMLTPTIAYRIGRGLAAEIFDAPSQALDAQDADNRSPVVVSRDMRSHSPELAAQLCRGLSEGGCQVLDIGLAATPVNYWANNHFGARGSVMVTASHNGPQYNGFKISGVGATPVDYASGLDRVEAYVQNNPNPLPLADIGSVRSMPSVLDSYLSWMNGFVQPAQRRLKIAIDTGNGMGGWFLPAFFASHAHYEIVPLFWELDGTFPNHEADPLKAENLRDVQRAVREHGCDLGVAFDGDADRCMFIDDQGQSISSDLITALIAQEFLQQKAGAPILYDLRSSRVVPESIAEHGGRPIRGRVGHSFMKRLLKETGAPFGGELSGHYYFADCFHTDSGLRALIAIMNRLQSTDGAMSHQAMSQIVAPLRKYFATGELNFHVTDVQQTLEEVQKYFEARGARVDWLDGLTVEMGNWWFNLRPSNTEPLLRLNLEAPTANQRDTHLKDVQALIGGPAH